MSFFESCNKWFLINETEYAQVEKLNEMPTDLIKKLDLEKLSDVELTYLRNVDLAEPVYSGDFSQGGAPPLYHKWTGNERKPFDMNKISIWACDPAKGEGGNCNI